VASALKAVAYGASLRGAAEAERAPYASVNKAWSTLEGKTNGPAWQAFVASLPPKPQPPVAAPAPAAAAQESPLGPRLKRKANRHGDAVPYGQHGEWGMFREGTKEMTTKIKEGKIIAADAQAQLEAVGVHTSACILRKKAKLTPGESPSKTGSGSKLDWDLQAEVHKEISILREHDLPVTKSMVKCMVLSKLTDEQQQELFPKGITNRVYYGFLDKFDMHTEDTKPLETDRDLWLTSKARSTTPHPTLARSRPISPARARSRLCSCASVPCRSVCRTRRRGIGYGPTSP
jgi:hypothetical protein